MNNNEKNDSDVHPPSYDETMRKISTATITSQQPCRVIQEKDFKKQPSNSNKIGYDAKGEKVPLDDINAPKDHMFFILITITLLGLVHMLPYSFFGMANEYWMYKFRNTTLNSTDANERTYLQINFSSMSGLCTTIPNVICNFLLTFVAHNFKAKTRVMTTLILHSVIFCVELIFVNINTDNWQEEFFILTLATMVLVMCSISFGAAGQYGLIPKLPPMYMKGFLLGGGMANLFNAMMRLLSVAISPSPTISANIYFGTATFLLLATTVMTYLAINMSFFRYYTKKIVNEKEIKEKKIRTASDFIEVLKLIWPMLLFNIFYLGIPTSGISSLVVSENHMDKSNVWASQYFVTVCSYFIPSLANTIGRVIYNKLDWIWPMPPMFIMIIIYQIINILSIYFANALPRHHLPVLFKHDWEYASGMAVHGLALGFISSMTTMKSIRMVPLEKTELTMILLYLFNSIIAAAFSPLGMLSVKLI